MTSENPSSTEDDGPRVVYIPSGPTYNAYHRGYDTVILDEALGDHPRAHYLIKEHELEHARQNRDPQAGILDHLKHEFKTDWLIYASRSEDAQHIRRYLNDAQYSEDNRREVALDMLTDFLRSLWVGLLMPIGRVNRSLTILTEDDNDD